MEITICSLARARKEHFRALARGNRFSHSLQLLDADEVKTGWPTVAPATLRLVFEDVLDGPEHFSIASDFHGPTPEHVRAIITFARGLPQEARLLIHCFAGASRSTAAALIVSAAKGEQSADTLAGMLHPTDAHPNALMLRIADELLACGTLLSVVGAQVRARSRWADAG